MYVCVYDNLEEHLLSSFPLHFCKEGHAGRPGLRAEEKQCQRLALAKASAYDGALFFILLSLFHPSFPRRAKGRTGSQKGRHMLWTAGGTERRGIAREANGWVGVGRDLLPFPLFFLSSLFPLLLLQGRATYRLCPNGQRR